MLISILTNWRSARLISYELLDSLRVKRHLSKELVYKQSSGLIWLNWAIKVPSAIFSNTVAHARLTLDEVFDSFWLFRWTSLFPHVQLDAFCFSWLINRQEYNQWRRRVRAIEEFGKTVNQSIVTFCHQAVARKVSQTLIQNFITKYVESHGAQFSNQ